MSTKTTFKRIALVAVAALGFGVLSVAPSSATVSGLSVTTGGTATSASGASDTTTAATFTVTGFVDSQSDTITVQVIESGARPTAVTSYTLGTPRWGLLETATSTNGIINNTALNDTSAQKTGYALADSTTVPATLPWKLYSATADKFVGAKFYLQLDSITAVTPGVYNYSIVTKTYSHNGTTQSIATITTPVAITVATPATLSTVASAVTSTLGEPSATSKVATVSTTAAATLALDLKNAASGAAPESVTATITGPGTIGIAGGAVGKSVVLANSTGALTLSVYADGTAGNTTINVSSTSVTFPAKSMTFFAKAAKTITATVDHPVLGLGANADAISATAVDANGASWNGAMYIYASTAADALIAGSNATPVACAYDSTDKVHYCPVTTLIAGTAKLKLIDAATVALATATSNEVSVTVSGSAVASVALSFDKSTYAPFEKATIKVTPLDASGKAVSARAAAAFLASGGITSTYAFSAGSDTLTASSFATSALTGAKSYTVYMPSSAGDVVISATGGSALPAAAQVKISATATVATDAGVAAATDAANEATDAANAATDAALAAADAADAATAAAQDASDAVAALSASVSKLISSLRAQITSLTNLVIKIQKKVKA